MRPPSMSLLQRSFFLQCAPILGIVLSGTILGCGSNSSIAGTTFSGNTSVTIGSESTANDQISQIAITLDSLQLTDEAGHTVQLLPKPVYLEMLHVNGNPEPMTTVSVQQGVYTSATISVISPVMTCLGIGANGMNLANFFVTSPNSSAPSTVTLPQPITISGATEELALDLNVANPPASPTASKEPWKLDLRHRRFP
jgi:hypothetical protein